MRAFVVGGSPVALAPVGLAPQVGDFVVAADLGARHAVGWGWPVHLLVGDLDSLPPSAVGELRAGGLETLQAPAAKDQTDTELALAVALQRTPDRIIICAALGGRTDHLLANVLLLANPSLAGIDVCLVDGLEEVRLAQADGAQVTVTVSGAPGDLVSLLPLGADAEGVSTVNFLYPLAAETLRIGEARGVSNVMTAATALVSFQRGRLLVLHQRIESR